MYFHSFALPPGVSFQNVFCSKSRLKCSWFPNFKPSFLKIGIDGRTTFQYSGDGMLSGQTFLYFDGGGRSAICVWDEHKLHFKTDGDSSICVLCSQPGNQESDYNHWVAGCQVLATTDLHKLVHNTAVFCCNCGKMIEISLQEWEEWNSLPVLVNVSVLFN
jgi:hypothetical protein